MAELEDLDDYEPSCSAARRNSDANVMTVDLLYAGDTIAYTIPSFNVITVQLTHVVINFMSDAKVKHLDAFLQEHPDIQSHIPSTIEILDSCHINMSEFSTAVDIDDLITIPSMGVWVIWKWNWLKSDARIDDCEEGHVEHSADEDDDSGDDDSLVHSIIFKCIGATRNPNYQTALRMARDIISKGLTVPVKPVREPNNVRDARAIAFVCHINGKDYTIGYVINELLEEVHKAIDDETILTSDFSWVRYITDWSRSGPGFFAGIKITKKGKWSHQAVRLATTKRGL